VLAFAKALLAIPLLFAAPDLGVVGDAGTDAPVAAAETALPEAHPLDVKAASDHPQITLGESFNYVIEVVHDAADTYALPQASTTLATALGKGSLELRGEPTVTRATDPQKPAIAKTTLTIPLADVASMKPSIPALDLEVQGPSGARVLHLPEQALTVESLVAKEGEPNAEHAHHGPKPPEQIKIRSYLWLWLLLGIGALAAALNALQKLRKKQAEKAAEPPPPERADHEAQRRLLDLRHRAPWSSGDGRGAIFELSEIVRTYLGKALHFNATDLTSEELVVALGQRNPPGLNLTKFTEQVRWEDLVKFAKVEPTAQECLGALDEMGDLIEQTRTRLEAQRHADLAAAQVVATPTVGTPTVVTPTTSPAAGPKLPPPPAGGSR
jgi:hypothetical protein